MLERWNDTRATTDNDIRILLKTLISNYFVNLYQNQYPYKMWHDTREATDKEIDVLLMTLMPKFFSELGISLDKLM
ncbi:hypothetical protein Hdeb2414_s0002g00063571 [Helianthus debilis subsp. tardiflorus]